MSHTLSSPTESAQSPSSLPSVSSHASSSRTGSSNLPLPPPSDRVPPPKHRSTHPHKFKLGRKAKEKKHERKASLPMEELDDDWLLEGGDGRLGVATAPSSRRVSNNEGGSRPPVPTPPPLFDSQLTEKPPKEEKKKLGRGRGLAKKTSQLFTRSRDKDSGYSVSPDNASSLALPTTSRQASHSSVTSGDSVSTSASARPPGAYRPPSDSTRSLQSRRLSQDSSTSWQQPIKTVRSGSTSTYDTTIDPSHIPIPLRQAQLSASVPSLSRQALPLPANGSTDGPNSVPSRMSSWFSNLLGPSPPPDPPQNSSPRKPPSAAASFLNAARQRAVDGVRHLLDSEAQPDKCTDTMWVMGVAHPGYRPITPLDSPSAGPPDWEEYDQSPRRGSQLSGSQLMDKTSSPSTKEALRPATWKRKDSLPTSPPQKGFGNLFSGSTISLALPASISPVKDGDRPVAQESPSKNRRPRSADKEVVKWPEAFYDDFRSRVWCTYRSQYAPIVSLPENRLLPTPEAYYSAFGPPLDASAPLPLPNSHNLAGGKASSSPWSWSRGDGGLTSDAGWGCMLRTGQSMLANALIHLHLGRDWRLPAEKPSTTPTTKKQAGELEAYATYVRIMSWFLDDPSPLCPFSVHRMALIGKELGKEVGEWFGPSTAAGALKALSNSFTPSGLAVATATDSMIYKSDVYAASKLSRDEWDKAKGKRNGKNGPWGHNAVLILVGLRLGLDGVNPIYYESIKALFTFPQSVGIAGGRPSSSYYFVASQGNSLFYLDPHFTRAAVPLEVPPAPSASTSSKTESDDEEPVVVNRSAGVAYTLDVVDVDDLSDDSDRSSSPVPRAKQSRQAKRLSAPGADGPLRQSVDGVNSRPMMAPRQASSPADPFTVSDQPTLPSQPITVDPQTQWYANAYPDAALRTFHCEKVKKMPLAGLDPSMLLGFLITNQEDFEDFCERVQALPHKIFSVQDEPPSWDEDSETGLESVSEPDMDDLGGDEEGGEGDLTAPADSLADLTVLDERENGNLSTATVMPVDIPPRDEEWEETHKSSLSYTTSTEGGGASASGASAGKGTECGSWQHTGQVSKGEEAPNGGVGVL